MQCNEIYFLAMRLCIGDDGAVQCNTMQCNAMKSLFLPCIGSGGGVVFSLRPRAQRSVFQQPQFRSAVCHLLQCFCKHSFQKEIQI